MAIGEIMSMVFKIVVAALIIAGLFNEDKLADLEEKLFAAIRRRFQKGRENTARRQEELTVLSSAPAAGEWAS